MKRKLVYILLILSCFLYENIFAQEWKQFRYEASWGLGVSIYSGDVNSISMFDNAKNIRPLGNVGMRYKVSERIALKLKLSGGYFGAKEPDIPESSYYGRHFRTYFFDPAGQVEFYLKPDPLINSTGSGFLGNLGIYLFTGASYLFYLPTSGPGWNPSPEYNYLWKSGSGQSLYNSILRSIFVPVGGGLKLNLNNRLLVFEIESRIPFPFSIDYASVTSKSDIPAHYYIDGFENYDVSSSPITDVIAFARLEFIYLLETSDRNLPILRVAHKKNFNSITCPYEDPKDIQKLKKKMKKHQTGMRPGRRR
ncbi:hypothetical protein ACFLSA_05390 [Bacteroidota bacterium]